MVIILHEIKEPGPYDLLVICWSLQIGEEFYG